MRESKIESAVGDYVKENGGLFYKFVSPGLRGVPDRLVILPGCAPFFMEFKATGEKLSDAQQRIKSDIHKRYTHVYAIDDIEDGKEVIRIELKK